LTNQTHRSNVDSATQSRTTSTKRIWVPRPSANLTARTLGVAALVIIFAVAAVIGAYAHWILWHPMDGVLILLAAGVALLTAGVVAIALKRGDRRVALVPLVVGVGLLAGQGLGPSRQQLQHDDGTMTVTLEQPNVASGATTAQCETVASGSELQVYGASRLDIGEDDPAIPPDIDQREFVTISLRVGDRWRDRAIHRSDNIDLLMSVGGVVADVPEMDFVANDDSLIEIEWTNDGGSLRFDRLVVDPAQDTAAGELINLAGVIGWTCRLPEPTPAQIALAESVCARSTYVRCLDDLLLTMRRAPGSLVAICDYADGEGEIVPLETADDAEAWCAGDGDTVSGRVAEVVRLP
jgi:hypothetical protein